MSKTETMTNVLLTAMSILVILSVGRSFLPVSAATPPPATVPTAPGTLLPAGASVDLSASRRTVLLVLNPTCRFCTESMPLYRRMAAAVAAAREGERRLVVVAMGGLDATRAYVTEHRLIVNAVVPFASKWLGHIAGTPTVVIADRGGVVLGSWSGLLDDATAARVLRLVADAPPDSR
jgi:hypothetical protein